MEPEKTMNITDENTTVLLWIYFRSGNKFAVKGKVKWAREAMLQWKKYMLYSLGSPEKRRDMEIPFSLYHFLEGDESKPDSLHANASFFFGDVCGMQYFEMPEEEHDSDEEYKKRFLAFQEKQLRFLERMAEEHEKGDEWRRAKCAHPRTEVDAKGTMRCADCHEEVTL